MSDENSRLFMEDDKREQRKRKVVERCCICEDATGRAGKGEDSLYVGEVGPLCGDCYGDMDGERKKMQATIAALRAENERLRAEADALKLMMLRLLEGLDDHWMTTSEGAAAVEVARILAALSPASDEVKP